jgi:hypothetical protein
MQMPDAEAPMDDITRTALQLLALIALALGCAAIILIIRRAFRVLKNVIPKTFQVFARKRLLIAGMIALAWYFAFFSVNFGLLGETGDYREGAPYRVCLEKISAVVSFPMEHFMWEPGDAGWVSQFLYPFAVASFWIGILISGSFWAFALLFPLYLAEQGFGRLRPKRIDPPASIV